VSKVPRDRSFATRRHSNRLRAGSMALHASSRIAGVAAQDGPSAVRALSASSALKTAGAFMSVLLELCRFQPVLCPYQFPYQSCSGPSEGSSKNPVFMGGEAKRYTADSKRNRSPHPMNKGLACGFLSLNLPGRVNLRLETNSRRRLAFSHRNE